MQAVILAGGKGTRLRPFTFTQPKPLLPLLDIPFLVWMLDRCQSVGLTEILISVGYLGDQIQAALGSGQDRGLKIDYIQESSPLDTAGALAQGRHLFTGNPLVVFNADILTDLDLRDLIKTHMESGARATLTLTRVEDITAYGLVELESDQRILSFREKPTPEEAVTLSTNTVNAGTYVLDPTIFDHYPPGEPLSFERRVFPDLLQTGAYLRGYIHHGYWRDLGTPASYYHGQLDILTGKMPGFALPGVVEHSIGIWIHQDAEVAMAAKLQTPCFIGSHSKIGSAAVIPAGTVIAHQCWINRRLEPGVYGPGTLMV